jgi:hypothetical protein
VSGAVLVDSRNQSESGFVLESPSSLAIRIAVTGRQNTYVHFASKKPIVVSARLMFRSAKRCALCGKLRWCPTAAVIVDCQATHPGKT